MDSQYPISAGLTSRIISRADEKAGLRAVEILISGSWPDHAGAMHAEVAQAFRSDGWTVHVEWPTQWLGDDRMGRIDIVARLGRGVVALELDSRRPRLRSVRKLRLFGGFRIVGLRGVSEYPVPNSIDRVVGLPLRPTSFQERQDKRSTRRPL